MTLPHPTTVPAGPKIRVQITQRQHLTSFMLYGENRAVKPLIQVRTLITQPRRASLCREASRSGESLAIRGLGKIESTKRSVWLIRTERGFLMHELYILRHGIAIPHGTPGVPEDERPLTPKGEKRIKEVGRGLAAFGLELDRIITSPLPRSPHRADRCPGARSDRPAGDLIGLERRLRRPDHPGLAARTSHGPPDDRRPQPVAQ